MVTKPVRIAIGQFAMTLCDVKANLDQVSDNVRSAKEEGARLIVFPELAATGYNVRNRFGEVALSLDSPEFDRLRELSHQLDIAIGFIEETDDARFFNSGAYLSAGEILHVHRKVYPPTYGIFDERRYFGAGHDVSAFDTPICRMAMLICGDCWHLALPYLAAHDGADILLIMAASSDQSLAPSISCRQAWERLNQSYALTLSCFVVFANRAGSEEDLQFWGGSHIVLPDGNMLAQAAIREPDLLIGEIDLSLVRHQRIVLPFRRDDDLDLAVNAAQQIMESQRHPRPARLPKWRSKPAGNRSSSEG